MKRQILPAAACLLLQAAIAQNSLPLRNNPECPGEPARLQYWVEELIRFGAMPNNVYDSAQIQSNAAYLQILLEGQGFRVELWPTPSGKPYVAAHLEVDPELPTLLIYSHYDGVPVDTTQWNTDPYQPVIKNSQGDTLPAVEAVRHPHDCRIYGRSVADSKNAIVSLVAALDGLKQKGKLPRANIKLLLDGEEEGESPFLREVVQAHAYDLKADLVISASGETHQSGLPTIAFGVRGILTLELTLYTAAATMHSGHFGNFTPNAALELSRVLASFKDAQGRVLIPGFYDAVKPLTAQETKALQQVPAIEESVQQQFGIRRAEMALSLQEAINLPTFNVRGLQAGYTGDRASNIIPARAEASIDIRLVEGMHPDTVLQQLVEHLQRQQLAIVDSPPGAEGLAARGVCIQVKKTSGFGPTKTDLGSPLARRVLRAVEGSTPERWVVEPTEGGSLNFEVFRELGTPLITLPVSNFDCNQHTHNENLRLDFFLRGITIFEHLFLLP